MRDTHPRWGGLLLERLERCKDNVYCHTAECRISETNASDQSRQIEQFVKIAELPGLALSLLSVSVFSSHPLNEPHHARYI